jgi:hypothetical protein
MQLGHICRRGCICEPYLRRRGGADVAHGLISWQQQEAAIRMHASWHDLKERERTALFYVMIASGETRRRPGIPAIAAATEQYMLNEFI